MLGPEATHVQVQASLKREGVLDRTLTLIDEIAPDADPTELEPVVVLVSDNGAQITSGSTREFMAGGRQGVSG